MSFCFTSGEGTADNAKAIFHRMQIQHSVNVDYEFGLTSSLGLTHEIRGPIQQIVTQPLGVSHEVYAQHAVPYPVSQNLGLTHTVVHAGSFGGGGGTGDALRMVWASMNAGVPDSGVRYFTHNGEAAHSDTPIVLSDTFTLTEATLAVDKADSTNAYAVRVYDESGPTLVATVVSLASSTISNSATGLSISLPAGSYGFTLERTSGSGASDFNEAIIHFLIEET